MFYLVSSDGQVKSLSRKLTNNRNITGRVLRQATVKGYLHVLLWVNGKKWFVRVHHLVAHAFCGEPPGEVSLRGWHVNHKNGIKTDNRAENLEWMTAQDNEIHARKNGLKAHGTRQWKAVLNDELVCAIRTRYKAGETITEIAKSLGLNRSTLYHIANNRTWNHVTPAQ